MEFRADQVVYIYITDVDLIPVKLQNLVFCKF